MLRVFREAGLNVSRSFGPVHGSFVILGQLNSVELSNTVEEFSLAFGVGLGQNGRRFSFALLYKDRSVLGSDEFELQLHELILVIFLFRTVLVFY